MAMNMRPMPPYNAQLGTPEMRVAVDAEIGLHTPPTAVNPEGHVIAVCKPPGEAVTPLGNMIAGKVSGKDEANGGGVGGGTPIP